MSPKSLTSLANVYSSSKIPIPTAVPGLITVPAVDNCSVHVQCVGKEQSIPADYWGESVSTRVCSPIRPTSFVNMATSAQRTLLGIFIWCTYAAGNLIAIATTNLCYSYMLYRRDCIVHIVYVSTCLLYVLRIKKA